MDGTVLVVGAGIAGLGLARALNLRGVRCSVLERLPSSSAPGLGVNLPGNAIQALAALGLAEDVVRGGGRDGRSAHAAALARAGGPLRSVAHVQPVTDRMTKIAGLPAGLRDVVAPVLGPRTYRAAYEPLRTPVTTSV